MRPPGTGNLLVFTVFAVLSLLAAGALSSQSPSWEVSAQNSLTVQGRPYIPVGLRIDGSLRSIREAEEAGVMDVLVEMPLVGRDWKETIAALESRGMRYMVTVSTPAPTAETIAVEPESYRLPGLIGTVKLNLNLPEVKRAYAVLASESTGTVRWEGMLESVAGKITYETDRDLVANHVLILYPLTQSSEVPDFWEQFDLFRDRLLQNLRENPFGPGYRGMVNPFGQVTAFMPAQAQFIPASPFFRMELQAYLKQKYGSLQTATTAWGVSVSGIQSIDDLAHVTPMWSESRGIPRALDWKRGDSMTVEVDNSAMWSDYRQVMFSSAVRRYKRLAESVRQLTNGPVVQDWYGWAGPYENAEVGLDGVGYQTAATSLITTLDAAARPLSTILRADRPQVLLATNLTLQTEESSPKVNTIVDATRRIGVRGWYFQAQTPEQKTEVGQIARLLATDESLPLQKPRALFFPEAALNPAVIAEVTPGVWWLPAPGAGRFLDFGEGVEGYQYEEPGQRFIALWSVGDPRIVKFRMTDPQTVQFQPVDGTILDIRRRRNEVEFNLPVRPVIIPNPAEIPVPMASYEITTAMVDSLLLRFGSRIDVAGTARYEVNLAINAFQRNPGAAFLDIRRQWRELLVKAAPYAWAEAENVQENTFSAAKEVPGASAGRVLLLNAYLSRPDAEHFALFTLNQGIAGAHDVWVAGHIPPSFLPHVRLKVGEAEYPVEPTKLSFYGAGLGWYKVGQIELTGQQDEIRLVCPPGLPGTLMIDALVASPTPFTPNGSHPPTAWLLQGLGQEPPRS